jgi:hypothetical protein
LKVIRKEEEKENHPHEKKPPDKNDEQEDEAFLDDEKGGRWKGKNPVLAIALRKTFINKVFLKDN